MRPLATLIQRAKLRDPGIPDARLLHMRSVALHRLDEGIADLFDEACLAGDLESATDLVVLMEKWCPRHTDDDADRQRATILRLKRMRGELMRCYLSKGVRPPDNAEWLRGDSDSR